MNKTFDVTVSDTRRKYPTKTYRVVAENELIAYGAATQMFIKENNHPPRGPSQRASAYYSRFWNKAVEVVA